MKALILGGAAGVWEEEAEARRLFTPDIIVAVNNIGAEYPYHVDHFVSFHIELIPRWLEKRAANGLPPPSALWSVKGRYRADPLVVGRVDNWGGSSGLVAVTVAEEVGATRGVLCGIPMDINRGHYDDPKPWRDAGNYRRAWLARRTMLSWVRSMSGYTRDILGAPDAEWINGDAAEERHHRSGGLCPGGGARVDPGSGGAEPPPPRAEAP